MQIQTNRITRSIKITNKQEKIMSTTAILDNLNTIIRGGDKYTYSIKKWAANAYDMTKNIQATMESMSEKGVPPTEAQKRALSNIGNRVTQIIKGLGDGLGFDHVFKRGKYAGVSIRDVIRQDVQYLNYLINNLGFNVSREVKEAL